MGSSTFDRCALCELRASNRIRGGLIAGKQVCWRLHDTAPTSMDAQATWGCTPLYLLHACFHFLSWNASHIHKPLLGKDKSAASLKHLPPR